jgi:putative sterol carrier protein
MARFLTQAWADEIVRAVNANDVGADVTLTIQYVVTGAPDGETRYWTRFAGGRYEAAIGEAPDADITLTQDYETAAAMDRGELIAQAAFMQGKLKVTGNIGKLLKTQDAMNAAGEAIAAIETEY